jgi:RNA recognition motif. (a.k.a. RRM, RBD, or RNP domain)
MATLWLTNVSKEATDDELRALAKKYAPELECATLRREEGDGSRPVAFMTFTGGEFGSVERLAERLNGMYWKERKMNCTTTF